MRKSDEWDKIVTVRICLRSQELSRRKNEEEAMADLKSKFEQFGRVFAETVDEVGKKAEDTIEVQRLKSQISSMRRYNDRDLSDMGKIIYERYKAGEEVGEEFKSFCEEIEKRENEMEKLETEISRIKRV